jgi:flagellar biosynthesis protein FlhF
MKVATFIADSPAAALAQIHQQLGPQAIVLSVRPVPASGLARLWQKNRAVEVTAGVDEPDAAPVPSRDVEPRSPSIPKTSKKNGPGDHQEKNHSRWQFPPSPASFLSAGPPSDPSLLALGRGPLAAPLSRSWKSLERLEAAGLLPVFADRLEQRLTARHGMAPPATAAAEWEAIRQTMAECWRPAPPLSDDPGRPHVFIGPPGVGKTTLLCKWLATSILREGQAPQVWRLDGASANTAELLSVYGEMFGLSVQRFWVPTGISADLLLVDLPGIEAGDAQALGALKEQVASLPSPRLHLVLNAAYDTPILFEQFRAFVALGLEDVSFTHLDEESRSEKLWNFVLGTSCPLRFLSNGQKIPGDFRPAEPTLVFRGSNYPENKGNFTENTSPQAMAKVLLNPTHYRR